MMQWHLILNCHMFVMSEIKSEIGAFNDCHEGSVVPPRNTKCYMQCRIASSSALLCGQLASDEISVSHQ